MRALPLPQRDGSIAQLKQFVNISDNAFVLFVAVLLDALRSERPHVVLNLIGKEGSGKSWVTTIARSLVGEPDTRPATALSALARQDGTVEVLARGNDLPARETVTA